MSVPVASLATATGASGAAYPVLRGSVSAGELLAALEGPLASGSLARVLQRFQPAQLLDAMLQGNDALVRVDGRPWSLPPAVSRVVAQLIGNPAGGAADDVGLAPDPASSARPAPGTTIRDALADAILGSTPQLPGALRPALMAASTDHQRSTTDWLLSPDRVALPATIHAAATAASDSTAAVSGPTIPARAAGVEQPLFGAGLDLDSPKSDAVARVALHLEQLVGAARHDAMQPGANAARPDRDPWVAVSAPTFAGQIVQIGIDPDPAGGRGRRAAARSHPTWTAVLHLDLPQLGALQVTVRVAGQTVGVSIDAESAGALRDELPQLAANLGARGLLPVGLAVRVAQSASFQDRDR